MKVLVIAKSSDDPATRYRVAPLLTELERRGASTRVVYEPGFIGQITSALTAGRFDLVFIQRKLMSPFMVSLIRRFARKIVFDHDDAIFLKSSGQPSATRSRRYEAITGAADLILGGNSYLCDAAKSGGQASMLVPTCVDVGRYKPDPEKEGPVTLVWIGSRSTSRYLEHYREELEAVGEAVPGLVLRVIGDFEFELKSMSVSNVVWAQHTETYELASAHIGIAPMTDDPWTRGKCALKVIQYMAAGLPVVSSDVGANCDVVRDGQTGYLVDSKTDWCDAVSRLDNSEQLRRTLGHAGRAVAESEYNQKMIARKVADRLIHLSTA